jgi:DNA-binding CsgD family transcriptional regulator
MVTVLDQPIVCPIVVGRDAALDALGRWLDRARTGIGQAALIAGEAGIGKSRLVAEARARRQGFLVLEGRCFEPDRALPYAPFVDLLQTHLADRSPEALSADLGQAAAMFGRLFPDLAPSLPAQPSERATEPEYERRRLVLAITQFVSRLAADKPILAIVEDLHWSDDASLEVILHLARGVATQPILLLLTYRNDEVQPALAHLLAELDRNRLAAELRLDRLRPSDVDAMVRAIFGVGRAIRADFLDVLAALTDGNPFFVEETLKSLVASGDIFYADGAWNRKDLDVLQIPRSVQDAVRRRAAGLGEPARRALALAAVAGRRFDFALLQDLLQVEEDDLLAAIKELIAAQLVVEESADRFAFRHALTRQAIYADLLARERQNLHRRVAEAIERQPGTSDAHVADLALHYAEAGVWDKALEFGRRAGEHARAMHSPRAAVEHLTRAIRAADALALPVQPDLYRSRGLAYETIGDFESARADHEAALAAARLAGDRPQEWQALLDLGFLWASRDYGTAGGYFDAALALAREIGDPIRLARSLNRVGNWHLNTGSAEEACRYHEEALALSRRSGDREGIAETLDLLALATSYRGDALAAAAYYDEVIALLRELGDRRGLVNSLVTSALLAFVHPSMIMVTAETGVEDASARAAESVAIAREIDWPAGEAFALLDSSYCFYAVGDYGSALDAARRSLHIAQEIGHKQWEAGARLAFGSMAVDLWAFDVAERLLERAATLAREIGSAYWGGMISLLLAYSRFRLGNLDDAEATIDPLLAPGAPMRGFDRLGWLARAELALARDDPAQALAIVDRLIAGSAHASPTRAIPPLWLVRGEALAALDRYDEAADVLRQGEVEARRRRARPLLWRILLSLGRAEQAGGNRAEADQAFADARRVITEIAATIPEGPIPELGIDAARAQFLAATAAEFPAPRQPTLLQAAKQAFGGLTAREREVAALIARGLSNRAIAEELVVGERTVATHVTSILAKLDFSSRAQIAAWAVDRGLTRDGSASTSELLDA